MIRCVGIEYRDFPLVEWTLYFKNTGTADTPILADIQPLDLQIERPAGASSEANEFRLHHHTGSPARPDDFQPHISGLGPGVEKRIAAAGGRSTNSDMSYFNVEVPGGDGLIMAVGWPGQWAARFVRDPENHLRIVAGQEQTHFKLLPGEEVRTPLIVLQFWQGDRVRSQNIWRRWMMAHSLPKPGGKAMPPGSMTCTSDFYPGMRSTAADEIKYADAYAKANCRLDYWWIDAGWYSCGNDWTKVGTWQPDPERYPHGIKEVSDFVHSKGMKLVVWFEPERVAGGTQLADEHPDWVLGGKGGGLLNFGNPDAWKWITDHVDKMITQQGIDLYRQDFNMDPLDFWRRNDAPDRQGITEIKHVTGLLAYWDELLRRHPNMPIDCCASGGRRNDLETLRRAFPLLQSDYRFEPHGTQGHNYGISTWIPYHGTGVWITNDNEVRSHWCSWVGFGIKEPLSPNADWAKYNRMVDEWRKGNVYFAGDYYPLTPYSLDKTAWMGWQYDSPERGEGLVQAFRHAESGDETLMAKLQGLQPDVYYVLQSIDGSTNSEMTGRELAEKGLPIVIKDKPGSAVFTVQETVASRRRTDSTVDRRRGANEERRAKCIERERFECSVSEVRLAGTTTRASVCRYEGAFVIAVGVFVDAMQAASRRRGMEMR